MAPHRAGPTSATPPTTASTWPQFRVAYADWLAQLPQSGPLYCLAEPIIARLEKPRLGRPPLLDRRAAEAERALNRLCRPSRAVGILDGSPIVYPFLSPPAPMPSEAEMVEAGWPEAVRREMRSLEREAGRVSVRLKGYAGWLLTEPVFLEERRGLAERWRALPGRDRPRFPLRRGDFHTELHEELRTAAPGAGEAFGTAFFQFCERWGLAAMASWDLPEPQGRCSPTSCRPGRPPCPGRACTSTCPSITRFAATMNSWPASFASSEPWPTRSVSLARRRDSPVTGRTPPSSTSSTGS